VLASIRRLFSRYGFHRSPGPKKPDDWQAHPFYTSVEGARNVANDPAYLASVTGQQLNMAPGAVKARRLAQIARQRDALKDQLAKAIKAKKARSQIYAALRALSIEELRTEAGK